LFRVIDRKEVKKEDYEKTKKTEKETVLETKRNKFLQSWLAKIREEKKSRINYNLFLQVTEDILSRFGD